MMPGQYHQILEDALRCAEAPDDTQGFADVRRAFLMSDRTRRRATIEGLKQALEKDTSSLQKKAQAWAFYRGLSRDHEALVRAGR
jgi:hypothetical protein